VTSAGHGESNSALASGLQRGVGKEGVRGSSVSEEFSAATTSCVTSIGAVSGEEQAATNKALTINSGARRTEPPKSKN